jgi:hypothetical protein
MKIRFIYDDKRMECCAFTGMRRALFLCVVFLVFFAAKAQLFPVGPEFQGEWFFDRAETQESSMNGQSSTIRPVLIEEISQKPYSIMGVPARITFSGGFSAFISDNTSSRQALAFINTNNNQVLEFRNTGFWEVQEELPVPAIEDLKKYPLIAPLFRNLRLTGDFMVMQCSYSYRSDDTSGNYMQGIITIYYKH